MTENEKRLLETRLSAEVGQPVMVVGSTAGLGEVERRLDALDKVLSEHAASAPWGWKWSP